MQANRHGNRCCPYEGDMTCYTITEAIRWVVMVVPVCLCAWRYAVIVGEYPFLVPGTRPLPMYWIIVGNLILLISLLLYLPIKVSMTRWRMRRNGKRFQWRPSILFYIMFSGAPCYFMICVASKFKDPTHSLLDPVTVSVLQVAVLGLTVTEWMSKVREELLTYDLVTAMAEDFFYAYDVIEFFMLCTKETHIYQSSWVYACYGFSVVSMFKYLPSGPVNLCGRVGPRPAASILINLLCCDLPFLVIRLSTLVIYGFKVSDFIHPTKNIALIVFACIQLHIIYRNMYMWLLLLFFILVAAIWWNRQFNGLNLPGPNMLMTLFMFEPRWPHVMLAGAAMRYGNMFGRRAFGRDTIILSGWENIKVALGTAGRTFAGRYCELRASVVGEGGKGIYLAQPSQAWKILRDTTCGRLDSRAHPGGGYDVMVAKSLEELTQDLKNSCPEPIDTRKLFEDLATSAIFALAVGKVPPSGDSIRTDAQSYVRKFSSSVLNPEGIAVDAVPLLRYLGQPQYRGSVATRKLGKNMWATFLAGFNKAGDNGVLGHLLESAAYRANASVPRSESGYDEADVRQTVLSLFACGITPLSTSLYCCVNIFLHYPEVMAHMRKEVDDVIGSSRAPTLEDRAGMPYSRACIWELARYTSLSNGGIRETTMDLRMSDFRINKGTRILLNIWGLHHNGDLWRKPWLFTPERFLDNTGNEVVPPEHINRNQMLAFSAGPRCCPGKDVAMATLFLWVTTLLQKFDIKSDHPNHLVSCDSRECVMKAFLDPPAYKAIFKPR